MFHNSQQISHPHHPQHIYHPPNSSHSLNQSNQPLQTKHLSKSTLSRVGSGHMTPNTNVDVLPSMMPHNNSMHPLYSGIFSDEKVLQLLHILQKLSDECFAKLHEVSIEGDPPATEYARRFRQGLDSISYWKSDVRIAETNEAINQYPELSVLYQYAIVRYLKELYKNDKSNKIPVSIPRLHDFLHSYYVALAATSYMQRLEFLNIYGLERTHMHMEALRSTLMECTRGSTLSSQIDGLVSVDRDVTPWDSISQQSSRSRSRSRSQIRSRSRSHSQSRSPMRNPLHNRNRDRYKNHHGQHKTKSSSSSHVSNRSRKSKHSSNISHHSHKSHKSARPDLHHQNHQNQPHSNQRISRLVPTNDRNATSLFDKATQEEIKNANQNQQPKEFAAHKSDMIVEKEEIKPKDVQNENKVNTNFNGGDNIKQDDLEKDNTESDQDSLSDNSSEIRDKVDALLDRDQKKQKLYSSKNSSVSNSSSSSVHSSKSSGSSHTIHLGKSPKEPKESKEIPKFF